MATGGCGVQNEVDDPGTMSTGDEVPLLANQDFRPNEVCPTCNRKFVTTKTSNFATLMHLLKANVGTGIMAMPGAMSNIGMLAGDIGLFFLGIICMYCMQLLVSSSKMVAEKKFIVQQAEASMQNAGAVVNPAGAHVRHEPLDYAETAEQAFEFGPESLRWFAPAAKFAVNGFLILTQFGFCCAYLLFVADSLHEVSQNMQVFTFFSHLAILSIVGFIMIFINFIPDLKKLTAVTSLAVVLQVIGLLMMLYYFLTGGISDTFIPYVAPFDTWPLYFGTAMYAFEGIGVVLPLENAMDTPTDFRGKCGILNRGMFIVIFLYMCIGSLGYMKYGSSVRPSITFNLPVGCFSEIIRVMFAFAIFLSYPLQMYVPYSFLLPFLKQKCTRAHWSDRAKYAVELAIRATFVIITFAFAAIIPILDLVISLVGAFASSFLALIFPPLIQIILIWNDADYRFKKCQIVLGFFISIFGVFGMGIGTYTSIKAIIKQSKNHTALNFV